MFCNQCEQTSKGKACTRLGICGKNEAVAIQQDKLVWQLRELAAVALMARDAGIVDTATDDFAFKALFSTLTNVNFDPVSLRAVQEECLERTTALAARVSDAPAPTPLAALDLRKPLSTACPTTRTCAPPCRSCSTASRAWPPMPTMPPSWASVIPTWPPSCIAACVPAPNWIPRATTSTAGWGWCWNAARPTCAPWSCWKRAIPARSARPCPRRLPGPAQGQGHPHLRPRPARPVGPAGADPRYGHQRVHPRRDAARPRLSAAACLPASGRALRHGLAEPAEGAARLPRRGALHHQLHPGPQRLRRQGLHLRQRVLARPGPLQGA